MDGLWRRPTDQCLRSGMPSLGEGPSGGAKRFCLLFWRLKKVSRRKGETVSSRNRKNGYVHRPRNAAPERPPSRAIERRPAAPTEKPTTSPPAAVTAGMDMYTVQKMQRQNGRHREQSSVDRLLLQKPAQQRICTQEDQAPTAPAKNSSATSSAHSSTQSAGSARQASESAGRGAPQSCRTPQQNSDCCPPRKSHWKTTTARH
ncbi:hypothetical protein SAMN03159453_05109 [Pseudomonas sp. NFIX28]|nr:hypothetical protein SAMN03159453_05109 [Pseudomonas sp. NFIX28]